MERGAVVWSCSCINALKGTVPRYRVNGKSIRTYAERFHIEPLQSSHVNVALIFFIKKIYEHFKIDNASAVSSFARSN